MSKYPLQILFFFFLVSCTNAPKWIPIEDQFIAKEQLFSMDFDNNWSYSSVGNSLYTFKTDDIKGAFLIHLTWDKSFVNKIKDLSHLKRSLAKKENAYIEETEINNEKCLYYKTKYKGSDMDRHFWYFLIDHKVHIEVSFFLIEDESMEVRQKTYERVLNIIHSLEFNKEQILKVENI